MRTAHTVAAVRDAEQALMATLPDGTLMQRAAAGLAAVCAGLLGQVYGARVVVLAGGGDNGGDALYAAARLAARGAAVIAVAAGSRLHEAGAAELAASGGRVVPATEADASSAGPVAPVARQAADAALAADAGQSIASSARQSIASADLIIDGLTGIGGHGGLREPGAALAELVAKARRDGALVVAVDLPSGIDADTGEVHGAAIAADVTVTFGTIKPGLLIDPGAGFAGTTELVDIGLRPYLGPPDVVSLQAADVAAVLPPPER